MCIRDSFSTDNKLAEGKDKVGFQGKRVVVLGVVEVNIHRVHILGLAVHALDVYKRQIAALHGDKDCIVKAVIMEF